MSFRPRSCILVIEFPRIVSRDFYIRLLLILKRHARGELLARACVFRLQSSYD